MFKVDQSPCEKIAFFTLRHRMGPTQRNNLEGSTRSFRNFWTTQVFNSKGPERSFEKKEFKKGCIPGDKRFRLHSTRIIEYDERQATFFRPRNVC